MHGTVDAASLRDGGGRGGCRRVRAVRLLDRYLLRELLVPLGFCLGGFFIFWLSFDLIGQISGFQQRGMGPSAIALYYWYELPAMWVTVLPVGLLLALLYALTNHARHNEITAMRAAGIGLWRICVPYLVLGLVFVGVLHVLEERVTPVFRARQAALLLKPSADPERASAHWKERIDIENSADRRVWNIGAFNEATGEMRGPRVRLWLGPDAQRVFTAKTLTFTNGVWKASSVVEWMHRTSTDAHPARAPRPSRDFPAPSTNATGGLAWSGEEWPLMVAVPTWVTNAGVRTNVWVATRQMWKTNLTARGVGGEIWKASAMDPTGTALHEVRVEGEAAKGGWRLVIGETARRLDERWVFSNVSEYVFRGANDGEPMITTAAEMVLPELTETPELVRSEIRVNGLRRGKTPNRAELTLGEIAEYRRIHPVVRPELVAMLDTGWHARMAAPWTCLVVVLIAVPFSVAPGRRNLFYGVAGSIGIAFAYFVLQRVGFAMGYSGRIPGWIAAWAPNGFFAATGVWLTSRIP